MDVKFVVICVNPLSIVCLGGHFQVSFGGVVVILVVGFESGICILKN